MKCSLQPRHLPVGPRVQRPSQALGAAAQAPAASMPADPDRVAVDERSREVQCCIAAVNGGVAIDPDRIRRLPGLICILV